MQISKLSKPKLIVLIISALFMCACVCACAVSLIIANRNASIWVTSSEPYTTDIAKLLSDNNVKYQNLSAKAVLDTLRNIRTLNVEYQSQVAYGAGAYQLAQLQDGLARLLCSKYSEFDRIYPQVTSQTQDGSDSGWKEVSSSYYYTCKNGQVAGKFNQDGN